MIHEYALEPELVATWGNRHDFRYFVEKFGLGQPRIMSRYPKRWNRLVWEAFRGDDGIERKRMEELLVRLGENMVRRRDYVFNPEQSWLVNAYDEDTRVPFYAILARETDSRGFVLGQRAPEESPETAADDTRLVVAELQCVAAIDKQERMRRFGHAHFRPALKVAWSDRKQRPRHYRRA